MILERTHDRDPARDRRTLVCAVSALYRTLSWSSREDNGAVDALREIEFDRATGKLSDTDYDELKASYTQKAINAMRASNNSVCENCGYEAEAGAKFCSRCGQPL